MKKKPPLIAVEYAREIRRRLGTHVNQIVLFGSQARGHASDASDYDFVVVVDRLDRSLRDQVLDASASLMDRRSVLCAALVYDLRQWDKVRQTPLGWNIDREGLAL
ncbi:MAG: nucleotidyltransferase domain-containing protein [Candidatus Hydrogenedentes bacterium]|nr:nucleotidyltransferase domain-containing protein [Candidatus Hydrogenedentota bacterium]